ncbi:MAG: 7-cyano-7-deazaguanine synthase QueC [Candidatus Omnitrophica bacterium]|nr:7-cyano-7-deazaguanine synthase QueC [Candidatus Omnitrophota bacterium]
MNTPSTPKPKAVVLLSGGLDSATVLAIARHHGFECSALSFRYGQRHSVELHAARRVAESQGVQDHRIVDIDLRLFGNSALTDTIDVPKNRPMDQIAGAIPVTYVPARNIIFLSFAIAMAEAMDCFDVFIGVNAIDYSGYPDCRPSFIKAFEDAVQLGTKTGVEGKPIHIHTPLIELTKADIIRQGTALGVDYALTHSCYDPDPEGHACGSCDSCLLRKKGFREAGVPDPTRYAAG